MENEHFISFKKDSKIKFPWVVGPLIIKNKVSLPIIEILLQEMNFKKLFAFNYGSHHIISQRRYMNKRKAFEHQLVEGLANRADWMEYQIHMKDA